MAIIFLFCHLLVDTYVALQMGLPTYCASWVLPAETEAITGNSSFCRSTNQSFSLSITDGTGAELMTS